MKTTYLVKKNPKLPTSNDNWNIMDGTQFLAFKQTADGKRRNNNFIKLCTEYDEECLVIECDLDLLAKWKSEINHAAYVEKIKKEIGYSLVSYHLFEMDEEELDGEEQLPDNSVSVEDEAIHNLQRTQIECALEKLHEDERDLLMSVIYSDVPMTWTEYIQSRNLSKSEFYRTKTRALEKMKILLSKTFL